jgi:hypothetical protein
VLGDLGHPQKPIPAAVKDAQVGELRGSDLWPGRLGSGNEEKKI